MDDFKWIIIVVAVIGISAVAIKVLTQPKNTTSVGYATGYAVRGKYTNLETWSVDRDVEGRVKDIKVHREAERS